jgi:hypothetical protein
MVVGEFLFIAFIVGLVTRTWLGFLGTFFGLFALYRFTRLSVVLSAVLSLYWGFLGYHAGAATGELGVGPLLAVVGFAAGAWAHRDGFLMLAARRVQAEDRVPAAEAAHAPRHIDLAEHRPSQDEESSEIIDVEYRVVS